MQSRRETKREKDSPTSGRAGYMGHSNYSSVSGYSSHSDYGKRPLSTLPILPTIPRIDDTAIISLVATNSSESHEGHEDPEYGQDTYALDTMKSAYSIPSSTVTLVKYHDQTDGTDSLTHYGTYGTYGANRGVVGPIGTQKSPLAAPPVSFSIGNGKNSSDDQNQGPGRLHQGHQMQSPALMKTPTRASLYAQEQVNEHQMRQWMRSADYGKRGKLSIGTRDGDSWWWWLSGKRNGLRLPGGERGEVVVSVYAEEVERWEPEDIGPGVKETRLGRYDHWL